MDDTDLALEVEEFHTDMNAIEQEVLQHSQSTEEQKSQVTSFILKLTCFGDLNTQHIYPLLSFPYRTLNQASVRKARWTTPSCKVLWSSGTSCVSQNFARTTTVLERGFFWSRFQY